MPTYIYYCPNTGYEKEVFHSIKECDEPSKQTLEEITHNGVLMRRKVTAPQIMGMVNGSSLKGQEKRSEIQKQRKKRSHDHFKKEIFPEIPKPEQRYFEKKWKKNS